MRGLQNSEFFTLEADAWFERNQCSVLVEDDDLTTRMVLSKSITCKRILDVGCSAGHRLARLVKAGAEGYGIDPSERAIGAGKKMYSNLNLQRGVAHILDFDEEFFDIVYLAFVFHWIDRSYLLKTVAEIDRVLKNAGRLIIADFCPNRPRKNRYHYRTDVELFTYKQLYWDIFTASHLYQQVERFEFQLPCSSKRRQEADDNAAAVVELRKIIDVSVG